jgi:hypothetical protein
MPPVELPIRTNREFAGETAIELTRPLVSPQKSCQADTVGEGPIECQAIVASGETSPFIRNSVCDSQARRRASEGIEFEG